MLSVGRDDTFGAYFSPCKGDAEAGKDLNVKVKEVSTIERQHLRPDTRVSPPLSTRRITAVVQMQAA